MVSLTTYQRDIMNLLLTTNGAIGVAELARQVGLTPRQVQYNLQAVDTWLVQRGVQLQKTSGVGVRVACLPDQKQQLLDELASQRSFQLVLAAGQRQQLLALHM